MTKKNKIGFLIMIVTFIAFGSAFAETAKEAYEKGMENYRLSEYDDAKCDEAISDFTRAIELDPNYADAYFFRAKAYGGKDNDRAISDFTRVIQLKPNDSLAYYDRGQIYSLKDNPDQAISDFTRAIQLDPNYPYVYIDRGRLYARKENYDRAISDFNKAIELNLSSNINSLAYYWRGITYGKKGDNDQAISDFSKAIEQAPNYADAYYMRALAEFYRKQDYNKALEDMHKAEALGYEIEPEFKEDLKKASTEKINPPKSKIEKR